MIPSWLSILFWIPIGFRNPRRLADNIIPEEIIDLTQDDDEPAPGSAPNNRSRYDCPICMSDLQNPVAPLCGHVFCFECLFASMGYNQICPLCHVPVDDFICLYI